MVGEVNKKQKVAKTKQCKTRLIPHVPNIRSKLLVLTLHQPTPPPPPRHTRAHILSSVNIGTKFSVFLEHFSNKGNSSKIQPPQYMFQIKQAQRVSLTCTKTIINNIWQDNRRSQVLCSFKDVNKTSDFPSKSLQTCREV